MPTIALDLGCGDIPQNPYHADQVFGIDLNGTPAGPIFQADLILEPIPFGDETLDFVTAFDFIEHVPRLIYLDGVRRHPFVVLMNEVSRVLKPGGGFFSHTPSFPHPEAFQDPTHVNIITPQTFCYFDCQHRLNHYGKMYGARGNLRMQRQDWNGPWLQTWMVKV